MAQQRGFRQRNCCRAVAVTVKKENFRVTFPMFSTTVCVPRNDLVEAWEEQLFSNLQKNICCRLIWKAMVLAVGENEIQAICLLLSVGSSRILATLHITFSWLPFPIGQARSQGWCRPYLAVHLGFFNLRTFSWSLSKVQVRAFYLFTLRVGSKCT